MQFMTMKFLEIDNLIWSSFKIQTWAPGQVFLSMYVGNRQTEVTNFWKCDFWYFFLLIISGKN